MRKSSLTKSNNSHCVSKLKKNYFIQRSVRFMLEEKENLLQNGGHQRSESREMV